MQIGMTPIDERRFGPDPEGKRKFVRLNRAAADMGTERESDLGPRRDI